MEVCTYHPSDNGNHSDRRIVVQAGLGKREILSLKELEQKKARDVAQVVESLSSK
jgi:hypothetical protein